MIREAIILAGGMGTRLRDAVPGIPKCLAPVAGRPFLFYVINYLRRQGVERFVFSLGYLHDKIEAYLQAEFSTLRYVTVVETEPLGTGGAIQLACTKIEGHQAIVANGDTLYNASLAPAALFHERQLAECTLLLKPMQDFDRYGVVETDADHRVISFLEKKQYAQGTINGGLYLLHTGKFLDEEFPDKFSFEKNYLEAMISSRRIYGLVDDGYFIDIGIPGDFEKAGRDFSRSLPNLHNIGTDWTLFLDRDGVINHEKKEDYILHRNEFVFYEGVPEAMAIFAKKFDRIILVTNQRGIGKRLMTEKDLHEIHAYMLEEIENAGGRVDRIYHCDSLDNTHPERKPNPGMAHRAFLEFPEIDPNKALVVGNKLSDMRFGRNAGIFTVFAATTNPDTPFPHPDIDFRFNSLADFAKAL